MMALELLVGSSHIPIQNMPYWIQKVSLTALMFGCIQSQSLFFLCVLHAYLPDIKLFFSNRNIHIGK